MTEEALKADIDYLCGTTSASYLNADKVRNKKCLICERDFIVKPYRVNTASFCSPKCYWASLKGQSKQFSLEHCQNISIAKTGIKRIDTPWNKGKKFPEISKDNHFNWRGGITPINKAIRNSLENKLWRAAIFERDKYTCQICGLSGCYLEADHYPIPFTLILNKLIVEQGLDNLFEKALLYGDFWNINNGRTLCQDCHRKTDNFAGRGIKRIKHKLI